MSEETITLKNNFPNFSDELIQEIETNSSFQSFKAGDVIMRTGQYIKSTILI